MKTKFLVSFLFVAVVFYACKKEFPRQAAVLTESMDKPTAMASGKVIDLGQTTIADHGFCWDNSGAPSVDGNKVVFGKMDQTGIFSGKIPGLTPNTLYYLKAWVSSENEIVYGDLISFITPDLPTVNIQVSGEITDTSANCSVEVTMDGGAPIAARGVCWSTTQTPDTNNFVYRDTIQATGSFSYSVPGLTAGTRYFARAFAKNIYGIRYSDETSFTTAQSATIPVVMTFELSDITLNSVSAGGNVASDGGASVTVRGVCWNTTPYPTTAQNKTTDGNGTGPFLSSVSGLSTNTTYYLRSYASNAKGTGYGEDKSFTTLPDMVIPTVITSSISNITPTSATSGGTVLADGGAGVTARGVCWSAAPNPTTANTHTLDASGLGTFVSNIISLVPGTKYYVRAYASNSAGTGYGNEVSFTAGQNITAPTVTTTEVVNIAQTTATSGGNVTADGGASVTLRGVCWSTSANPTTSNSKTSDGSGAGGYHSTMTWLTANTHYYVRAYATNSAGTSYGNQWEFTTLPEATIPTVLTTVASIINQTTATCGGNVTSDGGAAVTARGVCWNTTANPTTTNNHTNDGTGTGSFISNLTGLTAGTSYYYRAYATNSMGTAYGIETMLTTQTASTCGSSITINHVAGDVAPVTKSVTYGTVSNIPGEPDKCWITSNLGADHQATAVNDATEASAGWYWQFNRKQGYKHDGTNRIPNTNWITSINENSDWIASNDPCIIEFGSVWRIPTQTEWVNLDAGGNWTNWNGPWNSGLKLHAAGALNVDSFGSLMLRGSYGYYSSSSQVIGQIDYNMMWVLILVDYESIVLSDPKACGYSLRCLKE